MDEVLHIGKASILTKSFFASTVIREFERIANMNNMRFSS